eukprot:14723-Heterococcus_DN1.PRE.1
MREGSQSNKFLLARAHANRGGAKASLGLQREAILDYSDALSLAVSNSTILNNEMQRYRCTLVNCNQISCVYVAAQTYTLCVPLIASCSCCGYYYSCDNSLIRASFGYAEALLMKVCQCYYYHNHHHVVSTLASSTRLLALLPVVQAKC